jgi:hypothetical protein
LNSRTKSGDRSRHGTVESSVYIYPKKLIPPYSNPKIDALTFDNFFDHVILKMRCGDNIIGSWAFNEVVFLGKMEVNPIRR